MSERRKVVAIIGNGGDVPEPVRMLARDVGRSAIDAGLRVVTGGLGGVMAAASQGAREASGYVDGCVIGILPGLDRNAANEWVDVVIPTGMQLARNVLVVAAADVVIAIGGGSGTLSEIALAWQLGKPVVAIRGPTGWAEELAGRRIDERHEHPVVGVDTAEEAIARALELIGRPRVEPGDVGSGWRRPK